MNNMGFFSFSDISSYLPPTIVPLCGQCGLYTECKSPRLPIWGEGRKKILIIIDSPSLEDDEQGKLLTGALRTFLERSLRKHRISLEKDCWVAAATRCYSKIGPSHHKAEACRSSITNFIEDNKPVSAFLFGVNPLHTLLPLAWKESLGTADRWVGNTIPFQKYNMWLTCMYDLTRLVDNTDDILLHTEYNKHLKQGLSKAKKRPYKKVPKYEDYIDVLFEHDEIINSIEEGIKVHKASAFDYETNCLKPEYRDAKIITCAICFGGERVVAFPYYKELYDIMRKYLRSPQRKIAANMKFEERWSRVHFKTRVRNWYWDTMQAAHLLDNRARITSLKFQSFIHLGAPDYDQHIQPYLRSKNNTHYNSIEALNVKDILIYNGLDSYLEYELARIQIEKMHEDDNTDN